MAACGARTDTSDLFPGAGGAGGSGPGHDCCSAHSSPGCSEPAIQECVCGYDPECCTDRWSARCALTVPFGECGVCEASGGSGGGMTTGGRGNVGGSLIPAGGAPSVGGLLSTGGATIGGQFVTGGASDGGRPSVGGGPGGGGAGGGMGNCCVAGPPGPSSCGDRETLVCVCQTDPFCCTDAWDDVCTLSALDCGACGAGGSGGSSVGGSGPIVSGGTPGVGGGPVGVGGGPVGAGGGPVGAGGQGVGGTFIAICESALGSACGQCLCPTCGSEILGCLEDTGCWNIFACAAEKSCSGVDCYRPETCRDVIDESSGSLPKALGLLACTSGSGCGCF